MCCITEAGTEGQAPLAAVGESSGRSFLAGLTTELLNPSKLVSVMLSASFVHQEHQVKSFTICISYSNEDHQDKLRNITIILFF